MKKFRNEVALQILCSVIDADSVQEDREREILVDHSFELADEFCRAMANRPDPMETDK